MDIIIAVIIFILGAVTTWGVSHFYYVRSKNKLEEVNGRLINELKEYKEANHKLREALRESNKTHEQVIWEDRVEKACEDYRKRGTPKYMIDTFDDLSEERKAELFDTVIRREKGRKAKNNPYKNS